MLDSVCFVINPQSDGIFQIDLGILAEAMIFYGSTTVIAKKQIVEQLVNSIGPEVILELLSEGFLKIKYQHTSSGIHTSNSNSSEHHQPISFFSPSHSLEQISPIIFQKTTGRSGKGRRMGLKFQNYVTNFNDDKHLFDHFSNDLDDSQYVESFVSKYLEWYTPEYSTNGLSFKLEQSKGVINIESNLNLDLINQHYHKRVAPSHSSITHAGILESMLSTRRTIDQSSSEGSDLATNTLSSMLINCKLGSLFDRTKVQTGQFKEFQDFVFDDGKSIASAINRGEQTFANLLELLRSSREFKKWLVGKQADAKLVREYFKEVTKNSWIDKLPTKTVRWLMFMGLGLGVDSLGAGGLGTVVGAAISAADTFILDRIVKGWKPNQFVDNQLKKFVKASDL